MYRVPNKGIGVVSFGSVVATGGIVLAGDVAAIVSAAVV
jgi:hypothetical protein